MKKLLLLAILVIALGNTDARAQFATVNVADFEIIDNGSKFRFDVYVLRTGAVSFNMGPSTFVLDYTSGTVGNPVLSNQSSRYSTGNYVPMEVITFFGQQVALQINYLSGPGVEVLDDPGVSGFGERVATITMDILQAVQCEVTWDSVSSAIVTPTFFPIITNTFSGGYTGTLPVELANFNSSVSNNSVTLNWSTMTERNNSGFAIERKLISSETWSQVGFIEGAGNSDEQIDYSFRDGGLVVGNYNYRLKQTDFNGNFEFFELQNEVVIGTPNKFELAQNFPNPFNPSTKISFTLPADSRVTLEVYDISGKLVSTLINNESRSADYYTVTFDAKSLSSGMYFYTLRTDGKVESKKMLLVK